MKIPQKWNVLIILSLAMFIVVIDTTIMNVAINALVEDLNTTITGVQTAVTLYALVMASLFITGSKIGDIIGRKKAFIIGLLIYGVGTTMTAFSQNLGMLMFGWSILEGIGAALMLPILQTLLRGNYSKKDLPLCYGVIGGVAAVGAALGPIVGGYLTTYHSWRWAFIGELIIVIIVLAFIKIIKDVAYESPIKPKLDLVGVFLSIVGLSSIIYGIIQAQTYGFWMAQQPFMINGQEFAPFGLSITPILIFFGITVLAIFGWWQLRREKNNKAPLIRMSMFKTSGLKPGLTIAFIQSFAQMSVLFTLPLLLQISFSFDAFETGVIMLPLSIGLLIASLFGAKLAQTMYPRTIILIGISLMVVGTFVLLHNITESLDTTKLWPGLLIIGSAMGLVVSQIINVILSLVKPNETGEAASLITTFQQLGTSLGTAIAGTILMISLSASVALQVNGNEIFTEEQQATVITATEQGIEFVSNDYVENALQDQPENITNEIISINETARIHAIKMTLFAIAIITTFGVIATLYLPRKKLFT
ncbi:MAG: MFS transporter [Candidatus Moraniibacteriota bacterium]|jgi:EmrB/QacA subfamily drug resistance transporter